MEKENKPNIILYIRSILWRALKTFCEALAACITVGTSFFAIDWAASVSIALTATIFCVLTCIAKTPDEVVLQTELNNIEGDVKC